MVGLVLTVRANGAARAPAHSIGGLVGHRRPPHPRPAACPPASAAAPRSAGRATGLRGLRCRVRERRRRGGCSAWLPAMPQVALSSAERVLFPEDGITKGDLFAYYGQVADAIVPHLKNRPFTMKRYPHGITQEAYFQKQAPRGIPPWIPTRQFTTHPRGGGERLVDFALVNSRDALLWMVQQNCIDMNAWYSRVDKRHVPTTSCSTSIRPTTSSRTRSRSRTWS